MDWAANSNQLVTCAAVSIKLTWFFTVVAIGYLVGNLCSNPVEPDGPRVQSRFIQHIPDIFVPGKWNVQIKRRNSIKCTSIPSKSE